MRRGGRREGAGMRQGGRMSNLPHLPQGWPPPGVASKNNRNISGRNTNPTITEIFLFFSEK